MHTGKKIGLKEVVHTLMLCRLIPNCKVDHLKGIA